MTNCTIARIHRPPALLLPLAAGLLALAAAGAAPALASGAAPTAADGDPWPSFRGRGASGISEAATPPLTWDLATGKNLLWKTAIPGLGYSSPIVWGDRVFVTTAESGNEDPEVKVGLYGSIEPVNEKVPQKFKLICLDRRTGKILWERTAHEGIPKVKRHPKSSHANSTPATDGRRVVAFFGSEGLYAYDMDGNPLWTRDLGLLDSGYFMAPEAQWGFGSSPILHDGKVIVLADVQKGSFLAAFDAADGKELWRTPRSDVPTWGTPAIVASGGTTQVVVNGWRHMGGYDAATGAEIWKMKGTGDIPVPTPIAALDLIFLTAGHGGPSSIYAVRPGAKGDISPADGKAAGEHVAWSRDKGGAYMQTPLVYGDILYVCRDNGQITALDARTGKEHYVTRLGTGASGFTASGVASSGRIYYTSETGDVHVVKAGPVFELLAANSLGEIAMATPAISQGVIYYRTQRHLVALGEGAGPAAK